MEYQSKNEKILRCKTATDANKLAGSIYSTYVGAPEEKIRLRVIGAGALNQATKAVILSNKYFSKKGIQVGTLPSFCDTSDHMTAIDMELIFIK